MLLQYGTQGGLVETLQRNLVSLGYNLVIDGIFGTNTQTAVKDFQRKNFLVVDGIVGSATQTMIASKLASTPDIAPAPIMPSTLPTPPAPTIRLPPPPAPQVVAQPKSNTMVYAMIGIGIGAYMLLGKKKRK